MPFDPLISEPMLGIELAPFTCIGEELALSCLKGKGDGDRDLEEWPVCCARGEGTMSLGSIFDDIGGVDEA